MVTRPREKSALKKVVIVLFFYNFFFDFNKVGGIDFFLNMEQSIIDKKRFKRMSQKIKKNLTD